jgi:dihydrofolate reductase
VRVVVVNQVTLDGVMQGPGRPDEDTRGGFDKGGWATPRSDPMMGETMGLRMGTDHSFLFGRRTYEELLASWNRQGGPFRAALNDTPKYVASSRQETELGWPNSTLLAGDVPGAVASLRERPGGNLVVMGSGRLIRSLLPLGLVDELFLMVHPLVLGSGTRLFGAEGTPVPLRLTESAVTPTGVVLVTYEPERVDGLPDRRNPR